MKRLTQTGRFLRDVRRMARRGKDMAKLRQVVELLAAGSPLDVRHRDHALAGEWRPARD